MLKHLVMTGLFFTLSLAATAEEFEAYFTFQQTELGENGLVMETPSTNGPFSWYSDEIGTSLPALDGGFTGTITINVAGEPSLDLGKGVATLPIVAEWSINALAEEGDVTGSLLLTGEGVEAFDVNATTVVQDDDFILSELGSTLIENAPILHMSIVEKTGIFSTIEQVGTWDIINSGVRRIPFNDQVSLPENVLSPAANTSGEAILVGEFRVVPEPANANVFAACLLICTPLLRRHRKGPIANPSTASAAVAG